MGIDIIEGRGFTEQDREGSIPVVIINEALAQRLFPGEKALGKRVTRKTNGTGLEIIGITRDVKHHELTEAPLLYFDLPALQRGYDSYTNIVLRTSAPASSLVSAIRNELLDLDPSLDVRDTYALSSNVAGTLAATRLASTLIAVFGIVALLLASIGLYGVMAWVVGRRTHEVGIRMALGAQRIDILKLVLTNGLVLTLAGIGLGVLSALVATRLIDTQQLYEVSATDPFIFVAISLLLLIVSLL